MKRFPFSFALLFASTAAVFSQVANQHAVHFPGTADNYVSIPNSSTLNFATSITVEAWVNIASTASGGSCIVAKGNGNGGEEYSLDIKAGTLPQPARFYVWISGVVYNVYSTATVSANMWTHIAGTYDGTNLYVYVNGVQSTGTACTGSLTTNTHVVSIGVRQSGSGSYDYTETGCIDEVRIWNTALTAAQIQADMYHELSAPYSSNLVAYYKFNANSGTTAADSSGRNNNGSFVGSPTWAFSSAPIPFFTIADGSWSTADTWAGAQGVPPSAAYTNVEIEHIITLDAAKVLADLTIDAGGTLNTTTSNYGLTLDGSLSNSGTLTLNGSAVTIEGTETAQSIAGFTTTGTVTMTKTAGTATLQGAMTSGALTLDGSGGTLNLGNGLTHTVSGAVTLTAGTLNLGSSTLNLSGNLSGSGTLTASTGTVNFNGTSAQTAGGYTYNILKANNAVGVTLAGAATISTLTIGDLTANSIFKDGGFVVTPRAGSVLNLTSGKYNLGSATVGTSWPEWDTRNFAAGTTVAYVSNVAQTVDILPHYPNLTFSGAGTKTPDAGALSVSGNLTVSAGTLELNTNNNPVDVTGSITNSGTITVGSGAISLGGNWTNSGTYSRSTETVTFNGSSAQTIGGGVTTTFNNLTISNTSASVTLGHDVDVSGTFTVNAGATLALSSYNLGGSSAPSGVTMFCGAIKGSSITGSGSLCLGGNVTVTSSGTGTDGATISAPISLVANRTFTVASGGGAADLVISSVISNAYGVTKAGAGTMKLSASNTYTGLTTISEGTLKLGTAGGATYTPLGTTGSGTIVNSGATLDLNGFTLGTAEALTLNGTGIAGGGALTNSSATAASYSGLITLGSASSIVANAGNINITNAGTITGATFGLTLGGSGNGSVSSIIGTTSGTVTKSGTGTWTFSGASTYTGLTTVSAGTLKLGAAGGATNTPLGTTGSGTTVSSGAVLDLNGFTLGTAEALTLNGTGISGGGALTNSSATAASYSGLITLGGNSSIVANAGNTNITNAGTITGATSGLTLGGSGNGSVSSIIGTTSGTVTKSGTGTWTLSGASTYTGLTTVSAGTCSAL